MPLAEALDVPPAPAPGSAVGLSEKRPLPVLESAAEAEAKLGVLREEAAALRACVLQNDDVSATLATEASRAAQAYAAEVARLQENLRMAADELARMQVPLENPLIELHASLSRSSECV